MSLLLSTAQKNFVFQCNQLSYKPFTSVCKPVNEL